MAWLGWRGRETEAGNALECTVAAARRERRGREGQGGWRWSRWLHGPMTDVAGQMPGFWHGQGARRTLVCSRLILLCCFH